MGSLTIVVKEFRRKAASPRRAEFSREKVNVTPASWLHCSRLLSSRWCRYWFFAANKAVTHNVFHWAGQSQQWSFSLGDLNPDLIYSSFGPPQSTLQSKSRSVQLFLQGFANRNVSNRDRPCNSVCSNRQHLMHGVHAMRSKNYWWVTQRKIVEIGEVTFKSMPILTPFLLRGRGKLPRCFVQPGIEAGLTEVVCRVAHLLGLWTDHSGVFRRRRFLHRYRR